MKKQILIAMLAMGILAPAISFGQQEPKKKEAAKKESKMGKKEEKGKMHKGMKKENKMEKKEEKAK